MKQGTIKPFIYSKCTVEENGQFIEKRNYESKKFDMLYIGKGWQIINKDNADKTIFENGVRL